MVKRKKILYIITKSAWGGAQRYVYDLATRVPTEKFEVAVVCGPSADSGQTGELLKKLQRTGIRTIIIPSLGRDISIGKEIISFWSLLKIFILEKPDIVHLSSSKAGGLGAVTARLASLVISHWSLVIFTVHGWGFKEDRPGWQRAIIFFFSWLSAVFQNKIILINSADYRTAERFIPRKKLALIRHGIAPIDFLPRQEARLFLVGKTGQELKSEALVAGTVAELTKNKGINYLIDAVNQVRYQVSGPRCQVVIIGDGEEREKLQSQIRTLGLEDTMFLLGFAPDAPRYLKGFDIFVLPSVKEGLPYVLMEAMAAGVAVIASRVGGIPDLIEDQKSGILVPPKDARALANAIADLLAQPGKRQAIANNAKQIIETRFRINDMIANTTAIYNRGVFSRY